MADRGRNPFISDEEFAYSIEVIRKLREYYSSRVVGQLTLQKSLIAAIIADGHILLESVPGLAKTTAAKAISDAATQLPLAALEELVEDCLKILEIVNNKN
jgi:MoxR-like ATPase